METRTVVILFSLGALAAGLILGGIIGHFATKQTLSTTTTTATESSTASSGASSNHHQPNPSRDAENRKFMFDLTSAEAMEKDLKNFSSRPHLAGSVENNELGDLIEQRWKDYGFKTQRDRYNVLLSYPGDKDNRNKAEIVAADGSVTYTCQTEEKILDPVQATARVVPPFNAYAKNGTVESSKIYYVNYCRDEDFRHIRDGIDLSGSIVICRYGKIFRGNKVKLAEKHGAVGVIIYNDPYDYAPSPQTNATYEGTFPNSRYMPPSGAQRGSVLTGYSGDPLTPSFPAKDYAIRKEVEDVRSDGILRKVPTQPMGYEDAEQFLLLLDEVSDSDTQVIEDWRGGIGGVKYKLGGQLKDGKRIRIINNNREELAEISNVFGIIEGAVEPDRYVLLGNHYDSWMFGGTDALSGTIAMLETSRVFSELLATGWRPRRTIIFCIWDAEEYALIGSLEFVEDMRTVLQSRAVAYINMDSPVTFPGDFMADGSPLLYNVLYETAKLVPQPNMTDINIYDRWLELQKEMTGEPLQRPLIDDSDAGSDDSGFCHYNGIASADMYFKGSDTMRAAYPLYHTTYETFNNVKLFVDPSFSFHQAISRFATELIRSLADSVIIPFITKDYATRLQRAHQDLDDAVRSKLAVQGLEGSLDHLKSAIDKFESITEVFDNKVKNIDYSNMYEVRRVNDQLFLLERSFLFPLGILDRTYIKHVIFAPSAVNTYAGSSFPGIGDSLYDIQNNNTEAWNRVKEELTKAVYVVESACKFLRDADGSNLW